MCGMAKPRSKTKAPKAPKARRAGLPTWIRLPAPGEVEPITSLNRDKLNRLILPSREFAKPPVKSIRVPNGGKNQKGVRLIHLGSLLDYLDSVAAAAA